VIVIRAERVSADVYSARLRSRYTKANSIQTSPAGFRPVLIQEFYRVTGFGMNQAVLHAMTPDGVNQSSPS
jgi:hypothetical protein